MCFWGLWAAFWAKYKLIGCCWNRLDQVESDLPLSIIFTTQGCQKIGKTTLKTYFWALWAFIKARDRLVGSRWKRLSQAEFDLPLLILLASQGCQKRGKTTLKTYFWALWATFGARYRLVGCRWKPLGQAKLDLQFLTIFATREPHKIGKTILNYLNSSKKSKSATLLSCGLASFEPKRGVPNLAQNIARLSLSNPGVISSTPLWFKRSSEQITAR